MDNSKISQKNLTSKAVTGQKPQKSQLKAERLSKALRENLKRRKNINKGTEK